MRLLLATILFLLVSAAFPDALAQTTACSKIGGCISTTLKQGSTGPCVAMLQGALRATPDGRFGRKTKAAVVAYQKSRGLAADGIVGFKTWASLAAACRRPVPVRPHHGPHAGTPTVILPHRQPGDPIPTVHPHPTFSVPPAHCPGVPTAAIELIKEFEDFRSKAYPDPKTGGKPYTIGYGSTTYADGSKVQLGDTISEPEAAQLLAAFVGTRILPQLRKIPYWGAMSDNQRSALISFAYNLGPGFYGSSKFSGITQVLKDKDWAAVPDTLYKYRNPGTKVEAGLARRRTAEGDLWTEPQGTLSCS